MITNNPEIADIHAQIELLPDAIIAEVKRYGRTYIQLTDPTLDDDKTIMNGDYWIKGDPDNEGYTYNQLRSMTYEDAGNQTNGTLTGYRDMYCWQDDHWVHVFDTAVAGEAYSKVIIMDDKIQTEVARASGAEGRLASRITQTAEGIQLEAQRATLAEEELRGSISVTASAITAEVTRATAAEGELGSRISVTESAITTKVSRNDMESAIAQSASEIKLGVTSGTISAGAVKTSSITINNNGINISTGGAFTVSSGKFAIDTSGNVSMSGSVTATSGSIGGFTIKGTYITSNVNKMAYNDSDAGVYIGTDGIGLGANKFMVSAAGKLTATDALITGTISGSTISGGNIYGATISGNTISGGTISGSTISGGSITGTTISVTGANISGTINATSGTIGGWSIVEEQSGYPLMKIGSGTNAVRMGSYYESATGRTYHGVWVGAENPAYAPLGMYVYASGGVIYPYLNVTTMWQAVYSSPGASPTWRNIALSQLPAQ